jgi:hypothetical protein
MTIYDESHLQETLRRALEDPLLFKLPKGVIRYDYANTHGWWSRVTRDGVQFSQFFSDGKQESFSEGLKKAIIHRHQVLAAFPVTIKVAHARNLQPEPEKRIQFLTERGRGNKAPYVCWEAKWYDKDHKIVTRSFSVKKYGHDGAKEMALAAAKANHNRKPKIYAIPDPYMDDRWREIPRADVEVFATVNGARYGGGESSPTPAIAEDPFAYEGERRFEIHQAIERNRNLRAQKIEHFIQQHGKVFCELCTFRFVESYPFLSRDIIEVHHIVPLASLTKSTKVSINDLMLLCANCHLAVHQGDAEENLILAMDHFDKPSAQAL